MSVNLIDIDNFPKQTSPQGATCVVSSTIKEEAENAQARLKQIEIESIQIIECSSSVEHKKSSCGCETCNKEVKSKIDFEEEKIEDNNNNNQFIDKNEQQNDDRVKLIDKELISSITTTQSKS